jgi:protein tyrosine kinase modulator
MQSSGFDYKKYLQLLIRRKELFIVLSLVIMTGMIVISFALPRKYEASSTVFIEKNVIGELVKGITVTPSMEDSIRVLTYAITSRTLLSKVVDSLDMNLPRKSDTDTEALIKNLQQRINVKVKDKDLFIISFRDSNPRLARDFVNTLVRVYIEQNASSKRGESYEATKFLSEQIDTFKVKLEKAEADVNAYKREMGGVISVNEGSLFEEINTAQQKLYDLELRRRQLEGSRQLAKKNSDPLKVKLDALQKKLEDLRTEYTDNYPEVLKVKGDIETVRQQMKTGIKGEYQSAGSQELAKIDSEIAAIKATEDGLKRYIASNQALLRSIPTAKAGLEKLELAKNNQKNIYDQLFARHGQSEVSKQMEVQDKSTTFRIVDPAILPIKPASPDRLRIMLMGIIAGIAGSFGVLMLLDQMDDSVKEVETARSFGLPVLAIIPHIQDPQELKVQHTRSLRLYAIAGIYFMVILSFPVMEMLGLTYMDKLLNAIHPADAVQSVKDH